MKYNKILLIILISIISLSNIISQVKITKTTSLPFLLINTDARSGALGNNGVGTSPDTYAIFHNPAKATFDQNKTSASVTYTPWLARITNDVYIANISFLSSIDEKSKYGFDLKYFSLGEVILSNSRGETLGNEKPSDFSLSGIYSMKLSNNFSMGVGFKYVNSNYKTTSENTSVKVVNTFLVDVSGYYESDITQYDKFSGRYRYGFNIANIGPKVSYTEGQEFFVPANLKFGGSYDFILKESNTLSPSIEIQKLLISLDPSNSNNFISEMAASISEIKPNNLNYGLSVEYNLNNKFMPRLGYFYENEKRGSRKLISIGTGFKVDAFLIDLSYSINTSKVNVANNNTFRVSLTFNFNQNKNN